MSEEMGPNVGLQQSLLNNSIAASQAGPGESEGIFSIFFRIFKIGKLDFASNFSMTSVFSGLSLQGKSPIAMGETQGGFLTKLMSNFQGPQGQQVEHAAVDTNVDTSAGSGGGGDFQSATLNTIPTSAATADMPPIDLAPAANIAPPPKMSGGSSQSAGRGG